MATASAPGEQDYADALLEQVREAIARRQPLDIRGGGSKAFLGRPVSGAQPLHTGSHRGIVAYDPTELVVTVRSGTPLTQLQAALDAAGQMLAFEPPALGADATVGGMLCAGLSGPRRPWAGALRDHVLGTRLISGLGTHLRLGGAVMKNVAGYDVSRLLAGSLGCLGVVTEVSLKVLPQPRRRCSLSLELDAQAALERLAQWRSLPLPLGGACHDGTRLHLRLEGNEGSVDAARTQIGGETLDDAWWDALRERELEFFRDPRPLWRLSVPHASPAVIAPGQQLMDWGGAQRWLKSDAEAAQIQAAAGAVGGHAACHSANVTDTPFQPLDPGLMRLHQALKAQLDPQGIFNPGRMYAGL